MILLTSSPCATTRTITPIGHRSRGAAIVLLAVVLTAPSAFAGFAGTDVFLPSVGRGEGVVGAQWYTTVWVHNPGGRAADAQLSFYLRDQANAEPDGVYNERIAAGDTVRFVNAVEALFGVAGFGALRVASDQPLVVNSRISTVPAGDTAADSLGQFFAAVPASFALGEGDSTALLGVYRTDPQSTSDYLYNFGLKVTGVRSDRQLELEPFRAEVAKEGDEVGRYLCPECFGEGEERSLVPQPGRPIAE